MLVVLDTNVLISGVFWEGTPAQILDKWVAGEFTLCASKEMLEEYFDVLDRLGGTGWPPGTL